MSQQTESNTQTESAADLAKRLELKFTNLHLLVRALTHRSFVNENENALEDNERLEFLGDAVLDFVVGAWVYNRFPEMHEGDLTRMRSALVRTDTLALFGRSLDLGPALRLGRGELVSGGRQRDNLLCASFEAVIGAIYLDANVTAVEEFIEPMLDGASQSVLGKDEIYDAKSTLQEWAQSNKLGTPRYVTVDSTGPDHAKEFKVEVQIDGKAYGQGEGSSKQSAAQMAAQAGLDSLGLH
ncbi:MAG: ribonuclease III [Anaerolineae bacterium]|nr:ribonuclease III [Anaerolineae bacterium]MDK1081688.1 ribonuclease III [Anaerolineae bacterium]